MMRQQQLQIQYITPWYVTNTNSAGTLVSDDTNVDASSSLYVTKITHSNETAQR